MIIVVSPAKALDFESPWATQKSSKPALLKKSEELVGVLSQKSPDQLGSLMSLSDSLAELNFERYQDWSTPFTKRNSRPAILSFNGDTYTGMNASKSFSEEDYDHVQKTLRILSGLYGVLRPLDLIQPYRLEMGTKLETEYGKNLYEFWGNSLTESLNKALEESPGEKVLINLAPSGEILNFSLIEPSSNTSFNESILTAMNKMTFFEEVLSLERKVFEQNFRNFNLVFKSSGEIE